MTKKINKLIIWDQKKLPGNNKVIFLWNKRSEKYNSIINYIDENSKKIKTKVLDLFGNFGKSKIGNLNIVDYYNLEKKILVIGIYHSLLKKTFINKIFLKL